MSVLPDGEYILTERMANPLPSRLHSARRGWARAPFWVKGTHFTIMKGVWSCDRHYGYYSSRTAKLTSKQRQRVLDTLKPFLQLWAPVLPSQFLTHTDGIEALDFLVTTGRLTLDEVREANALSGVGREIADALRKFHETPAPTTVAAQAAAPATLRIGDVIKTLGGDRYVVLAGPDTSGTYVWESQYAPGPGVSFNAPFEPRIETIVGHVADMLAEGLTTLAPGLMLGYANGGHQRVPVRVGDILIAEGNTAVRALVLEAAPSDALGPRAHVAPLGGGAGLNGSISLQPGNGWVHEKPGTLGYDGGGCPVCVGDVLRCDSDAPDDPHSTRLLVTGTAPPDSSGPCVAFSRLGGPPPTFREVSLRLGNAWRVERGPSASTKPAPVVVDASPMTFQTTAFTMPSDDCDPFSLD